MKRKLTPQLQQDGSYLVRLERSYRAVFGLGEKFDGADQKGRYVRACVREKCFRQGEYTYLSMPYFATPDGFGVYVDTYVEVDFDFTREGEILISFPAGSRGECADVWLLEGTLKEILASFRAMAGMPRLFPKWVLGAWMSSNRWHTQAEVEEQLDATKRLGFPHNVLVIEPWSDLTLRSVWYGCEIPPRDEPFYHYSDMTFPENGRWRDPAAMTKELHEAGIRLLLWVVPVYAQGRDLETDCHKEYCLRENERVKADRLCVMNADGTPYEIPHTWCIDSMVPDFTSPKATEYWFKRFAYLCDEVGIDGFKTDGGEFIHDHSVRFADGTTGLEGQNAYCEQYTRAFADFVGKDRIVFSRAGGQNSPAFSVIWAGDQESTWQEFASVIKAGLSAGLSGIHCWGFDIAGFSGYLPSAQLYLRAVQAAAFVPVMQWHSDPVSNGRCDFTGAWNINDRSPWNIAAFHKDDRLLDLLRRQFYLHYNLIPYQYALMEEAAETGLPAMRHLALEFSDDENTFPIDDEFMLGSALLVAPVLQDYVSERMVYLPAGARWYDLYTGRQVPSGMQRIALTDEHQPVFLRDNSCVPLNLKGGVLASDVGNALDGYTELTFLLSGEGEYLFTDDLGIRIALIWTKDAVQIKENAAGTPVNILRIERDKLF